MEDSESTCTSADDRTEDDSSFSKDLYAEGLMQLLRPPVEQIDERVKAVRITQLELRQQIDNLAEDMKRIQDNFQSPVEMDTYIKKLIGAKRRIGLIHNVVQNVQERLTKIQSGIKKETIRRKALLDTSQPVQPVNLENIQS